MSLRRLARQEFGVSKEVVWYAIFKAIYKSGPWLKVRSSDGSDILFASKKEKGGRLDRAIDGVNDLLVPTATSRSTTHYELGVPLQYVRILVLSSFREQDQ
jgi:hypothetical protein